MELLYCSIFVLLCTSEVKKISGVDKGAVPPFGNLFDLKTFADYSLKRNKKIAFNAGMHTRSIKMTYRDYCLVVKPALERFSKEK